MKKLLFEWNVKIRGKKTPAGKKFRGSNTAEKPQNGGFFRGTAETVGPSDDTMYIARAANPYWSESTPPSHWLSFDVAALLIAG